MKSLPLTFVAFFHRACGPHLGAAGRSPAVTLFNSVRILVGKSAELTPLVKVLVRGSRIGKISVAPIPTDRRVDTLLMDGTGKTLMPGLIDAHTHIMSLRGFTSIRDVGGPVFGLKRGIDAGLVPGPRIPYPGKIGVVEEGALADLLLVDGDPIADPNLVVDPAKNFLVIMNDGKIHKDTVK